MNLNSFPTFCESLGRNKSLKDLDLRNNQITHTSALELCVAIEANNTLESLGTHLVIHISKTRSDDGII
jgi:Ran GTPase-activating protein (RanGAP) involved in mRNA processing and transport